MLEVQANSAVWGWFPWEPLERKPGRREGGENTQDAKEAWVVL